jgi:hypothetical protein
MTALNARMQAKSSRVLDGWVEKSGRFSISTSCKVARRFTRTTHLRAAAVREEGITVIRGYVPDGASRESQAVIFGALLLISLVLVASGNALLAGAAVVAGVLMYIPTTGDHINSEVLMSEVQRTLGAKATLPKKLKSANPVNSSSKTKIKAR